MPRWHAVAGISMPDISIVTATYNRSNVLRHAIGSVLRQSCTDWELIVVSDGCTDDTASVVASFADPRIRFVHLPHNHGEQSVPNNEGVRHASGRLLAFLNHDDLWFSDHLATLAGALERTGADLAYGLSARIDADGHPHLWGNSPGGRYEAWHPVPASIWLMRRDLFARVGPWTSAAALWDAPSQDWLRRAHAAGARLAPVPRLTAVQITSGARRGSYSERHESEHLAMVDAMRDESQCRERLLTDIAAHASSLTTALRPGVLAVRTCRALLARLCVGVGIPPAALENVLRFGRKGAFIRHLRRTRGLTPSIGIRV